MKPSTARVLKRLRQGPATTHDLMGADVGGVRFGARLCELRGLGFTIDEQRLPLPTHGSRYTLTFDAEQASPTGTGDLSLLAGQADGEMPPFSVGQLFDGSAFEPRGSYQDTEAA